MSPNGEISALMLKLAQLSRVRDMVKKREIEKRIHEFDQCIADCNNEICAKNDNYEAIGLASQLNLFAQLSRIYAETLELVANQNQVPVQDNLDLIKSVKSAMDIRKDESTKVMKLFTSIISSSHK